LFLGWRQLRLSRRAASVQTLVSLNESFRQCWLAIQGSNEGARIHALHDLLNLLEIASAALNDDVMAKRSGDVMVEFVCDQLLLLSANEETSALFVHATRDVTTFSEIRRFVDRNKRRLGKRKQQIEACRLLIERMSTVAS
jgi:hypothetical protein